MHTPQGPTAYTRVEGSDPWDCHAIESRTALGASATGGAEKGSRPHSGMLPEDSRQARESTDIRW